MVLTVLGIALESVELNCIAALVVAGLMLVASSVMLSSLIEKQNQRPPSFPDIARLFYWRCLLVLLHWLG